MIDSKELRIGNWVSAKVGSGDNWMNETVWGGEYISELEIHPDLAKPIPLSPDILTKAGFIDDDGDWLKNIDDRSVLHINLEKKRTAIESYDGFVPMPHITTLHDCQNAYKVLSGVELIIKL